MVPNGILVALATQHGHSFVAKLGDTHFQQFAHTVPRHMSDDFGVVNVYRDGHFYSAIGRGFASY